MKDPEEQKIIKQYLLGRLGEAKREWLEEKVLTDPEYKENVSMVEDELIEDFVADELNSNEREQFIEHFLSTSHQLQRVELAKAIHTYFADGDAAIPSLPVNKTTRLPFQKRWVASLRGGEPNSYTARATAVVLVLMMVGVAVFLVSRYLQEQPAVDPHTALQQKLTRLNDPRYLDDELAKNSPTFRVNLTSGFVRSEEGMPKISVPAEANVVQLELPLAQIKSYRATLRTIEGKEIFTLPSVTAREVAGNRAFIINVPSELLPHGDYELNLSGLTEDLPSSDAGPYYFRVIR
jgi:hypothetical protein